MSPLVRLLPSPATLTSLLREWSGFLMVMWLCHLMIASVWTLCSALCRNSITTENIRVEQLHLMEFWREESLFPSIVSIITICKIA